ncbi:MAG: mechanosensitive ion channel family protein [Chloroflexaceae bacterium]
MYMRLLCSIGIVFVLLTGISLPAQAQENRPPATWEGADTTAQGVFFEREELNAGLPEQDVADELRTPQATLEYFIRAARQENFTVAAYALNLNLLPLEQQAERASELARRLYYILQQHTLIDWDELPDRPDGQIDDLSAEPQEIVGQPRRSIRLGSIGLDGRSVPVRVQRIKVGDNRPVWVFSANTVENIPPLYEQYSPGFLSRQVPHWLQGRLAGNIAHWEWLMILVLITLSSGIGRFLHQVLNRAFRHSPNLWLRGVTDTLATPLAVLIGLLWLYGSIRTLLQLTGPVIRWFDFTTLLLVIIAGTWLSMRLIKFIADYVAESYVQREIDIDEDRAREWSTYLFVLRRVLLFGALLIGMTVVLNYIGVFERLGLSFLASAGLLSVIFGVAAQRVLGDLIASMQIGLTQPVRVGDYVVFEGEWGMVERITFTYLTIRTWDERRVVVPLQYFMSHPVQNLTKTNSQLIKPIYLYLDYQTDVEQIRRKFQELVQEDEDWDGVWSEVYVTEIQAETLEIRALCSARDPLTAWYLRFRLSEKLMAFVRELDAGAYLPQQRLLVRQDGQYRQDGLVR